MSLDRADAAARHRRTIRFRRASTAGTARTRSTRSVTSTRMAAIDRALGRHPGLFVTGSGFRGVGIPDCVADGRATARAVAEAG